MLRLEGFEFETKNPDAFLYWTCNNFNRSDFNVSQSLGNPALFHTYSMDRVYLNDGCFDF